MPTIQTDVLIIGAGPAGASTALFLAKKGIDSHIVDKAKFPRDKICGDALSGKAVQVLNKLDRRLIDEISGDDKFLDSWGVTFVSPSGESLRIPFTAKKEKEIAPGFISKRIVFDNFLVDQLKANNKIGLHEEVEIRNYRRTDDFIRAESRDGRIFHAKIIIACDGAYSTFSKNIAGLKTEPGHNCFGLRAYYKNVKQLDKAHFIELHFLKEIIPGYFWIFPLPGGLVNVGLGMRADKMRARNVNLKKSFESILKNNDSISARFSGAEKISEPKLFGLPLGSKMRTISGERFMLCGDAAQLIDPFTGEGIGNAMLSGMLAADQVEKCLQHNNFSARFIRGYEVELYRRLGNELKLSYRLQQLVNFPGLFNLVVKKANSNELLRESISGMFGDLSIRSQLKNPMFYLWLLFH